MNYRPRGSGIRGQYRLTIPAMVATGSRYGRLQTDTHDYLCPECGGYGYLPGKAKCDFCGGSGTLSLDDPRVKQQAQDGGIVSHGTKP